jgi:hypothetical protein
MQQVGGSVKMPQMRFTLGKMFLAIAMLALACAGMMYSNDWWANGIFSFTVAIYVCVAISAIRLRSRALAAAVTFSMVGGLYLFIVEWRPSTFFIGDLLDLIGHALKPDVPLTGFRTVRVVNGVNTPGPLMLRAPDLRGFLTIGHCVFSWIFAVLAAWFAGRMYDRREKVSAQ